MSKQDEHQPGEQASATGHYEELNIFGTETGRVTHATEAEPLPALPRGFMWRHVRREGC